MKGFNLNQFGKQIYSFILLKIFGIQKNKSNFQQLAPPFSMHTERERKEISKDFGARR